MNISQIIKERRKSLNLTQEQIANHLGVSTPAVSKWESGVSYPDITLLPNLAKILKTDVNTLLSFQSDLSDEEINNYINDLSNFVLTNNIEEIFEKATKIISEYPNCYKLILNIALSLDGFILFKLGDTNSSEYEIFSTKITNLYKKVMESSDVNIKSLARQQLICREMNNKNFDEAEKILETIPDKNLVDKSDLKTRLEFNKGNFEEAKKAVQEKLYKLSNDVHAQMLLLLDIELEQNNIENAKYIATKSLNFCQNLDLSYYMANLANFQLYTKIKSEEDFIDTLSKMIDDAPNLLKFNKSPLYNKIVRTEKSKDDISMLKFFISSIVKSLENDDELDFVKDNPKFKELIDRTIKKSNR